MGQAWYAKRGDREVGPVAQATLEKWAGVGRLRPSDHIRQQDETDWRPASEAVQFKKQPTIADRNQPDTKPSPDHVQSSATPFGEWYKERWLSKLRWYFQTPLWLIYGFVWIPIWYVATATPSGGIKHRWASLSFAGKAVASLPLLLLLVMITPRSGSDSTGVTLPTNMSDSPSSVASNPSRSHERITTASRNTSGSNVGVIDTPIMDAVSQSRISLSSNGEYFLAEDTGLWHVPSKTQVFPFIATSNGESHFDHGDQVVRATLTPDGKHLVVLVAHPFEEGKDVGEVRLYSIEGSRRPSLQSSTAVRLPKSVEEAAKVVNRTLLLSIFPRDNMLHFNEMSKTIMTSSDVSIIGLVVKSNVANVVKPRTKGGHVEVASHPLISTYSGKAIDFTGVDSSDEVQIADIAVSPNGTHILIAYEDGGIQLSYSDNSLPSKMLSFPSCLTKWKYLGSSFSKDGKLAATVLRQESGWTEGLEKRVFQTSRYWTFVWNTTDWSLTRSFGPAQKDSPNDDSSPQFIGTLNEPSRALFRKGTDREAFEVVDLITGAVISEIKPEGVAGSWWDASLSGDGRILTLGQDKGPYQVVDTATGNLLTLIMDSQRIDGSDRIATSADGRFVAIGYRTGVVRVWDRSTGRKGSLEELARANEDSAARIAAERDEFERIAPPLSAESITQLKKGITRFDVHRIAGGKPPKERIEHLEHYPNKAVFPNRFVQEYQIEGEPNARIILIYEVDSATNPRLETIMRLGG